VSTAVGNLGTSYEERVQVFRDMMPHLPGTQQKHHILKSTSVKTSEFARINICMGENV